MLIAVILILTAIGVIAIFEFHDSMNSRRQRLILDEGIRTIGTVKTVERLSFRKGAHRWSISVEFEYGSRTYFQEEFSMRKPVLEQGAHVTVHVYQKDPHKSFFIISG